jgi:hypothetical protein
MILQWSREETKGNTDRGLYVHTDKDLTDVFFRAKSNGEFEMQNAFFLSFIVKGNKFNFKLFHSHC